MAGKRFQRGSLSLRGNKWYGRWREDEKLPDGNTRRIDRNQVIATKEQCPTRRAAEKVMLQKLAEINSLDYRPGVFMPFAVFAKRWQELVLPTYKLSTQREYRNALRSRLLPAFGKLDMREITTQQIQKFVAELQVGAKTKHNLVATLRAMWRVAKSWGYVKHDPFLGVMLPDIPRSNKEPYTEEETLRMIEAAPEPLKTFLYIAVETGMRPGETCGLDCANINLDERLIVVRQSAWRGKLQMPKSNAGFRSILISDGLAEHLKAQGLPKTGLLFQSRNGRPWREEKVLERKLKPLLEKLEIPNKGLHAFRHLNCSMMDRWSMPIKLRQARAGHASVAMTIDRYAHVHSEDERRIADNFGTFLRYSASKVPAPTDAVLAVQ